MSEIAEAETSTTSPACVVKYSDLQARLRNKSPTASHIPPSIRSLNLLGGMQCTAVPKGHKILFILKMCTGFYQHIRTEGSELLCFWIFSIFRFSKN
jgi:hypothetical protein